MSNPPTLIVQVLAVPELTISTDGQGPQGPQGATGPQGPQGIPGSSLGGGAIVTHYPFTYQTTGLMVPGTGYGFFTPTVGDVLLDATIIFNTSFNGTSPGFDFGPTVTTGLFASINNAGPSAGFADSVLGGGYLRQGQTSFITDLRSVQAQLAGAGISQPRVVPGQFTNAQQWKMWVTSNSKSTGANPGSTQGAGTLILVTSTPL